MEVLNERLNAILEGWGLPALLLVAAALFWGRYNHRIFFGENGGEKGAGERRERDLAARRRWIEERTFERRYLQLLGGGLARIAERWTGDAERLRSRPEGWSGRLFGVNPFTEGSYRLCLRLALFYPILGFIVAWGLGGSGNLSGLPLLPELDSAAGRWLLLAGMGLGALLFWKWFVTDGWKSTVYFIGAVAVTVAIAVAFPVAVAVAVAFVAAVAVAGAVAFVVAGAVAFAFAVAGVGAFTFAGAGAVAVTTFAAVAVGIAAEAVKKRVVTPTAIGIYWVAFSLLMTACLFGAILWTLPRAQQPELLLLPLFLGLLPLANALFDWISLGFTRGLLHAIHRGHHTGPAAIGWALADTLLALLFLTGIATLSAGLLALLNALGDAYAGRTLIDLGALMGGIRRNPASVDYAWVHFMMLSTLVPTLVHFTLAGSAAMLAIPGRWRQWVLAGWEERNDARFVAFLLVTATPLLGLAGPLLLLAGLWQLLTGWHGAVGWALFDWVAWVIGAIDPTFVADG